MADSVSRNALALRELEALTRFRTARLLALDRTRVTREEAEVAELPAMSFVEGHQRSGDREAQRTGLPRLAAADDIRPNVEATERVRRRERLLDGRDERGTREVVA